MLRGLNSKPAQSRDGLSPAQHPELFPRPQRVGDTNKTPRYQAPVRSYANKEHHPHQFLCHTLSVECLPAAGPTAGGPGNPTNPLPASAWQEGCRKCQPTAAGVGRASQPSKVARGTPAPGEGSSMHSPSAQQGLSRLCVCVSV